MSEAEVELHNRLTASEQRVGRLEEAASRFRFSVDQTLLAPCSCPAQEGTKCFHCEWMKNVDKYGRELDAALSKGKQEGADG